METYIIESDILSIVVMLREIGVNYKLLKLSETSIDDV